MIFGCVLLPYDYYGPGQLRLTSVQLEGNRPRGVAFITISAVLTAPSLRMMWARWDSTVLTAA